MSFAKSTAILFSLLCPLPAFAQQGPPAQITQRDLDDCWVAGTMIPPNARVVYCTKLLQSGQNIPPDPLAKIYTNRGRAYNELRLYDQAIADYNQAISLAPKLQAAYYNRGNVYRLEGRYDQAIADYTIAIMLDPNDPEPYGNRGYVYELQGKRDQAIADYRASQQIAPNDKVLEALQRLGAAQ
jgi:tetratricopeptide (TPR) repeat protein